MHYEFNLVNSIQRAVTTDVGLPHAGNRAFRALAGGG
jgi:hypothetical protein